jgi:hypothetical protein
MNLLRRRIKPRSGGSEDRPHARRHLAKPSANQNVRVETKRRPHHYELVVSPS